MRLVTCVLQSQPLEDPMTRMARICLALMLGSSLLLAQLPNPLGLPDPLGVSRNPGPSREGSRPSREGRRPERRPRREKHRDNGKHKGQEKHENRDRGDHKGSAKR